MLPATTICAIGVGARSSAGEETARRCSPASDVVHLQKSVASDRLREAIKDLGERAASSAGRIHVVSMRLSDANLRGKTVIGADGLAVGDVAAVFLNSDTWSVESLQVKLRREIADHIGASRTMFHAGEVEIPVSAVQSVSDAVVLSIPVDGLRRILPLPGETDPPPAH
jgi:sporulation protein YlmC with PRC-barrel domain